MAFPRYNKYGNTKVPCRQLGTKCKKKHDSKAEAERCNVLAMAEKNGKLKYLSQVRFDLVVNDELVGFHVVDFMMWDVVGRDPAPFVEDVKGAVTAEWRLKYKLFHALYPKIPYIVNFGGTFGKGKKPVIRKAPKKTNSFQTHLNL